MAPFLASNPVQAPEWLGFFLCALLSDQPPCAGSGTAGVLDEILFLPGAGSSAGKNMNTFQNYVSQETEGQ